MDTILRAEHLNFVPGQHNLTPAELGVALHWKDKVTGLPKFDGSNMPMGLASKPIATAHISHGRWVADCTTPGCHAASYVSPDDPKVWCTHCENAGAHGKWVKVDFPKESVRERIEALLMQRPLPENRNWFPYESLKDLKRENEEHGVSA